MAERVKEWVSYELRGGGRRSQEGGVTLPLRSESRNLEEIKKKSGRFGLVGTTSVVISRR